MTRTTFIDWYKQLPIPWLVAGYWGQREQWPKGIDDAIIDLDEARHVAYAAFAPSDAIVHLGNDRCLIQGPAETEASFRIRIQDAWAQWERAGTPLSVIEQLEFYGLRGATWVQQNGLQFQLSAAPTPGVDPTPLLLVSNTSALASPLVGSVPPHHVIPAGTPWWYFDDNVDLTNRFQIILPSWPWPVLAFATFNNSDSALVTWPVGFTSTTYNIIYGPPSANVALSVDGATKTAASFTLMASGVWTGTVPVIGFVTGQDPFTNFSTTEMFGAIKRIIKTFRPNALCMGVSVAGSGRRWGIPSSVAWGDGGTWGGFTYQIISEAF